MNTTFKIALAQTQTCRDAEENLKKAEQMTENAKKNGVGIIIFPELFMANFTAHDTEEDFRRIAQTVDGDFVKAMRNIASGHKVWMVFGILEKAEKENNGRYYNTILIVDDQGTIVGSYRKTHLFVIDNYRESDFIIPGDSLFSVIRTPFGRIGLMVCYELRFPEIARKHTLAGADLILVPSAWLSGPGKSDQLRTLVKARAMENTVFAILCNSCGKKNMGESAVIGPDGRVWAECGNEESLLITDVDLSEIENYRKVMPSLEGRRPELY